MFKQMRTINLKFIGAMLFAVIFLVGGFFMNAIKVGAEETQSVSYSLSAITSYTNSDGGTSTVVRVGCMPGSGDVYDINSGKLCSYIISKEIVGCVSGSGDKYDVNTGALCLYNVSSTLLIGCSPNSIDLYDINNGNRCTNKAKPVIKSTVSSTPKLPANSTKTSEITAITAKEIQEPGEAEAIVDSINPVNPILSESELTEEPVEEITDNNLITDGKRINSLFTWPMSARSILLIIIILLGIGYGVYGFIKKEQPNILEDKGQKDKKAEVIKPIVVPAQPKTPNPQAPPANTQQPKTEGYPLNTPPLSKPQNPPINNPQVDTPNTPSPQIPLDIPDNFGPF